MCVCCSWCVCCVVWCAGSPVRAQVWCVCRSRECAGTQRSLSEEQYLQVVGRCAVEGMQTQDSHSICQLHHDRWIHRYKPTKCAACPQPLSSAWRPCPEWMREQLHTHHGAFVHERPCYKEAVARRTRQAADTQPEVEQENEQPNINQTFQLDVRQHMDKAMHFK